jgi:hypothetical protein
MILTRNGLGKNRRSADGLKVDLFGFVKRGVDLVL